MKRENAIEVNEIKKMFKIYYILTYFLDFVYTFTKIIYFPLENRCKIC